MSIGDSPDHGIYARIPIADLTLVEAYDQVDDPSYWDETMPVILFHFSVGDYWTLRVHEHERMMAYLTARGLYDD